MISVTPDFRETLVLTGGGTGGHYFPAVALAEGATRRWPGVPVVFLGAQRGIEARQLPASGWQHTLLDVEGFLGRSPLRAARSAWKLWTAVAQLKRAWRLAPPRVVIGTGGYAAAPALLAARSLGIPFFLHESNAAPGALVKLVAARAERVWCGMEAVQARLPKARCRLVGTPVRAGFLRDFVALEALASPFRLLVLGRSGGARALNETLLEVAPALLEAHPGWQILHQTGQGAFEGCLVRPRHPRHEVVPFIHEVDQAMEAASLVLGRAGASTCAELQAAGRPSVLVPLPTSANDHQRQNARAMVAEGRALLLEQGEGFPARLQAVLETLMGDSRQRFHMAKAPERNHAVDLCLDDLIPYLG